MYRVAIVEDEADQADALRRMMERSRWGERFDFVHAADAASLKELLSEGSRLDILMMDIELGSRGENGIELVKRCFPEGCGTQVIYVTGFIEYCTSVYRTEHVYFLTKPVSQSDLDDALDRAVVRLQAVGGRSIEVRFGGTTSLVRPDAIEYVESDKRKMRIHVGRDSLEMYGTLSSFSEQLPASFFSCHKSFLVNMDRIVELRANEVVLASGAVVPVSQKRRRLLREAFHAHLRSRL